MSLKSLVLFGKLGLRAGFSACCALLLLCFWLPATPAAHAAAPRPVKIGVLAFRPKPQTLEQWRPLAASLGRELPECEFSVEALTYPELNDAVSKGTVDFVFTNPSHFVQLKMKGLLSAPLATLAVEVGGKRVDRFGGVIVTGAGRNEIASLRDVRGKKIAVPDVESLGGYQMQAYELYRAGVEIPADATLLVTGMPHDNVLKAVLEGRADVGFVRSGVFEGAAREGKIDVARLKILNLAPSGDFPQKTSTRLYPEWPFSSLAATDEKLARHVAAALLTMGDGTDAMKGTGIHGFSVPADYTPVEEVMRALRFPPFDTAPDFTFADVWKRYRWQALTFIAFFAVTTALGFRLALTKRKLVEEKKLVDLQTQKLVESESNLRAIIDAEPECVKQLDRAGRLLSINRAGLAMLEADEYPQLAGRRMVELVDQEYKLSFEELTGKVFEGESGGLVFRVRTLKGGVRWLETRAVPMHHADGGVSALLGITRDITARVNAENERNAALDLVKKLEGILPICASCKKIRDEDGRWNEVESYVARHSEAEFSHGICPDCIARLYPDINLDEED